MNTESLKTDERYGTEGKKVWALPAPGWHTDHGYHGGQVWELMRGASTEAVFALLDDHRQFVESLTEKGPIWSTGEYEVGAEVIGWRETWGPRRGLSFEASAELRMGAEIVEAWIRNELVRRYRDEVEKRASKAREAAMTRRAKAAMGAGRVA